MATTGIRGTQIKDETIESVDLASGSIKKGELNVEAVSSQTTITSVDTSNDYLLIFDATDSALKKVAPTNLGVGGSGSPGGSDTEVQYNDGGSFDGVSGATTDGTNITFGDTALLVGSDIIHSGDTDTLMRFTDDKIVFKAGNLAYVTLEKKAAAPHEVTINDGANNVDFVVKGNGSNAGNPGLNFDASTNKLGINGVGTPSYELDVAGDIGLAEYIYHKGDDDTFIRFQADDINIQAGAVDFIKITEDDSQDMIVFNEGGADVDFRVESDTHPGAILLDAGTEQIGLLTDGTAASNAYADYASATARAIPSDIGLFVSGAIGGEGTTSGDGAKGTVVIGGDAVVSGSLSLGSSNDDVPTSRVLDVYGNVSSDYVAHIDNDQSSAGHVMKLTTDGTGTGTHVLDMESSSDTIFRARADGRFGFGTAGVSSMGAGTFVVGISGGHTSDIAISKRLQHLADGNTYMEFPDPDQLQFVVGGVDILHVTEDGTQDKIVFNEGGADVDFRVESDTHPGAILLDGGSEQIGLLTDGTSAANAYADNVSATARALPSDIGLFISGAIGGQGTTSGDGAKGTVVVGGDLVASGALLASGAVHFGEYIYHAQDTDTFIRFEDDLIKTAAGGITFTTSKRTAAGTGSITFNNDADDINFIVESPQESKAIYLHAANEILHINHNESGFKTKIHSTHGEAITVNNNGVIFNDDGVAGNDLRVESNNDTHLFFVDAGEEKIGIATSSPSTLLDVSGSAKANTFVTTPYLTDLGSGTATHLTSSNSVHFLDADSVTLGSGKSYHELYLAPGSTNGQHIQLTITSSANNPVKLMGDAGGDKAQGTVSFSGAPANGQTVSFPNVGGGTTYTVTWDTSSPGGEFAITSATNVTAGIGGISSANDFASIMNSAIDLGIQQASWPFTIPGTYAGGTSVTLSQASAASGNETITENSDNTTVSGFSGGTALIEGTLNSTYGVALAGTSANGGLLQGAHLIYDSNSEKWQVIAGTQLTS